MKFEIGRYFVAKKWYYGSSAYWMILTLCLDFLQDSSFGVWFLARDSNGLFNVSKISLMLII